MERRNQELFVACFQGLMECVVCLRLAACILDTDLSAHPGNRAVEEAASSCSCQAGVRDALVFIGTA